MIQELIDEVIDYISVSGREEDVAGAKKDYFSQSGGIFGEEVTYDMRIGTFLEWYALDRRKGGQSVVDEYVEKNDDAAKRAEIIKLKEGVRSIFEILRVSGDKIRLKDLYSRKKYTIMVPEGGNHFQAKSLLETRVFPKDKKYIISRYYIMHPAKVKKFIISKLKEGAAKDDLESSINILANMSLRWERFTKYRIEEIYK
ncbi:MAG: hypothetical protein OEV42_02095 [Deltaproteobacteria bacterium]|nr:hypothetical protein [Deltaproteobacteria bacterium]